ncbi:MAG: hypothetical protein WDN25_02325 [Acetobacteraceae bacterium]
MGWPEWLRISGRSIAMARRLRRTGRQDLIDAVERGDMTLEAAVEQAERPAPPEPAGEAGR